MEPEKNQFLALFVEKIRQSYTSLVLYTFEGSCPVEPFWADKQYI
jgi:hypothetical protein